ncbi:MAG: potassium transporter TrkG [bacterium]|nr:potassium transporter TrkG [bacterium]
MKSVPQFLIRKPVSSLLLVFFITILIGTALLKLPWATHQGISFIDALFTATSATTVTGLIVKNTSFDFTLFGQIVILFLIQIGGLGIIAGATFAFLFFKKGIGIGTGAGLKTILGEEYISEVKSIIKFIIKTTFLLEAIGAVLLFFWWRGIFPNFGQATFNSIFHSISAFCNAGFSLFQNSLENFKGDIFINILFSILIILGGIGIPVLKDIQQKISSFFKKEKAKWTLHSKLVLISTFFLLFLGAFLFYVFEKETLSFLTEKEFILASFFQSITTKAGFNTVSIGDLTSPTLLLLIFLMFVGGAPGSVAGGIKVISLALIFLAIISFFAKKEEIVIFGRTIPRVYLKNVFILASVYLFFCLVIFSLLLYIEKGNFEEILFETFSAMGTVGLSTGVTPYLSDLGKILITISMFIGRLLPISIAIIGLQWISKSKVRFPEEKIILG